MTIKMRDALEDDLMVNMKTSVRLTRQFYRALIKHAKTRRFVSIDLGDVVIFSTFMWFTDNVYHYRVSITRFTDFKVLTIRDKVGNINEEA